MAADPAGGIELRAAALVCLLESSIERKCAASAELFAARECGRATLASERVLPGALQPGRPPRPELVPVHRLAQRGLGTPAGRAAFLHAIAHIEFNAINLAWDAVARFTGMPDRYYDDWARVAEDEARHFRLLQQGLADLGHSYGDFPAHNGLWEMAERTAHSCLERMALVPRVLEARGLDVTPAMIDKLAHLGDHASVAVLQVILREEVAHVEIGSRWFRWCCEQAGVDPLASFRALVERYALAAVRGPFNRPARYSAGFSGAEMAMLESLTESRA